MEFPQLPPQFHELDDKEQIDGFLVFVRDLIAWFADGLAQPARLGPFKGTFSNSSRTISRQRPRANRS